MTESETKAAAAHQPDPKRQGLATAAREVQRGRLKIAYLGSGAAGSYCGMCLHDNTLAAALIDAGDDVLLIPTYTPLRTDEVDVSQPRIFFGGINVYLQQKLPLFRHTPWWLDRLLDMRSVLNWATRGATSIDPAKLGDMTVSMIEGESGVLHKELEKLVVWLETEVKPDLVHLSNAMLAGMVREIKHRLNVPVVCSLAGEDVFLERLVPPYYERARTLLRERCADIDAFTVMNRYYADYMVEYAGLVNERIHIIPHGLKMEGHAPRVGSAPGEPFTIGYMARICPDKGLHLLIDALILMAQDASLPPVQLKVAGYMGKGDRRYLQGLERKIAKAGLADRYQNFGELDRDGKLALLRSLDVMGLPTVYRETKGLSVLEAMANAVPVVLPNHGTFPELIEDTGGGLLCEPENPESLAETLAQFVRSPELVAHHGQRGHAAILDRYHAHRMARQTRELYESLLR